MVKKSNFYGWGKKGSADTYGDFHFFSLKFYTEVGNMALIGNNKTVFFIIDPINLGNFIDTHNKDLYINCNSVSMLRDY